MISAAVEEAVVLTYWRFGDLRYFPRFTCGVDTELNIERDFRVR